MSLRERAGTALRWGATCTLVCWLLLALDNWAAARFGVRPYQELFYDARVAVGSALLVFVPWLVIVILEAGLPRAPWIVGLLCVLAAAPASWEAATQLAEGEGIEALKIAPRLVRDGAVAVLSLGVLVVWWLARLLRTPRGAWRTAVELLVGLGAVVGLAWFEQLYLRTYGMLAPFVLASLAVLATGVVDRVLSLLGRVGFYVAFGACAVAIAVVVAGFVQPGWVAAGRRTVLADETVALYVDPLVFTAETASVRFDISRLTPDACTSHPTVKPWPALTIPPEKRRNVVLISVDALRADWVGRRRNGRSLTPNLDRFLAESRRADRAVTSYPATLFALSGAMDGLLPSEILFAPEPPESLLRAARRKLDVVASVLPNSSWFMQPAFAQYVQQNAQRRTRTDARFITDEAIRSLRTMRRIDRRHLLWAHYLEPHGPYVNHPELAFGEMPVDRYDSEVAYFDRELGRLLDVLRNEGWYDDTLIVFFSDHGQALGERGYFGHHVFLNRWIADIPFAFRAPGVAPGRIAGPVQITDVAATALHFIDLMPSHVLSGMSLLAGDPPASRAMFSEAFAIRGRALFDFAATPLRSTEELAERIGQIHHGDRRYHPKVSLVKGDYRLIVRRTTGTHELYDRRDGERVEQSEAHPEVVQRMRAEMAQWHARESAKFYCDFRAFLAKRQAASQAAKPAAQAPAPPAAAPGQPVGSAK